MDQTLEKMIVASKEAGEEIARIYRGSFSVSIKTDKSYLTEADLASNKILEARLRETLQVPILSEESQDDPKRLSSRLVWIVDPLDGTKHFVEKTGEFAVLIALAEDGEARLAVAYKPVTGECYVAQRGRGAYRERNGQIEPVYVSTRNGNTRKAALATSGDPKYTSRLLTDLGITQITSIGGTAQKLLKIASGEQDFYVHLLRDGGEWDTCAPGLIVEEAGGRITTLDGRPIKYNKKKPEPCEPYLVTNGRDHQELAGSIRAYMASKPNSAA